MAETPEQKRLRYEQPQEAVPLSKEDQAASDLFVWTQEQKKKTISQQFEDAVNAGGERDIFDENGRVIGRVGKVYWSKAKDDG